MRSGKEIVRTVHTANTAAEAACVLTGFQLPPGPYRLRVAVVDAALRSGSLDVPITIGLRSVADLQSSDLLVGAATEPFVPVSAVATVGALRAGLELCSPDPAQFFKVEVLIEVAHIDSEVIVASAVASLRPTDSERRQTAEAILETDGWKPGEYIIRGVIARAGRPIGKVSRSLTILPAPSSSSSQTVSTPPTDGPLEGVDPVLGRVLRNVASYVHAYGEQAAALVATETYTQRMALPRQTIQRQLMAEFALVKTQGRLEWAGYRDVISVDGEILPDRHDRLARLVKGASADPSSDLARIAEENAHFNMGPIIRNFNVPTATLFFFHPSSIHRFSFVRKGERTIEGVHTWEIAFRETQKPTMVMTRSGRDVPCEGTLWVDAETGAVVRTRLQLRGFADAFSLGDSRAGEVGIMDFATPSTRGEPVTQPANRVESGAEIEVSYRRDEELGMWVPARMSEEYEGPIPRIRGEPVAGSLRTTATYSNFRRFATSGRVKPPKDPSDHR